MTLRLQRGVLKCFLLIHTCQNCLSHKNFHFWCMQYAPMIVHRKGPSNILRLTLEDCQYAFQILVRPHNNSNVLFPLSQLLVILCIMYSLFCFCRLQSLRILQRKRKRILKHFSNSSLLQNQVTFTVHIYTNP